MSFPRATIKPKCIYCSAETHKLSDFDKDDSNILDNYILIKDLFLIKIDREIIQ